MTFDHSWAADALRCAVNRLEGQNYDPVLYRDQYDGILALAAMESNHRILKYKQSVGLAPTDEPALSLLDQLIQNIQHP